MQSTTLDDLFNAIEAGDMGLVKQALEKHQNINARENGHTPLELAIIRGEPEIVVLLLERGANVNSENHSSNSPLLIAVLFGQPEIVAILLEKGAYPNRGNRSQSPLHCASKESKLEISRLLLENGAGVNLRNLMGETALHNAIFANNPEMAELMLKHGADVSARDIFGNTPLHWAAARDNFEIVSMLLNRGADITIKNKDGKTPLEIAEKENIRQLITEFVSWKSFALKYSAIMADRATSIGRTRIQRPSQLKLSSN